MIYKIDHYYNIDHDAQCLLIRTDIEVEDLIKILASIQFRVEEFDEGACVDEEHLLHILTTFYNVKDVKDEYGEEFLPHTKIPNDEWELINIFVFDFYSDIDEIDENIDSLEITQIDLYEAREYCCGKGSTEMMEKYLPESNDFKDYINSLKAFYSDR